MSARGLGVVVGAVVTAGLVYAALDTYQSRNQQVTLEAGGADLSSSPLKTLPWRATLYGLDIGRDLGATVTPAYDPQFDLDGPPAPYKQQRTISPPEWAPWSLLSASAVVLLYAMTTRRNG